MLIGESTNANLEVCFGLTRTWFEPTNYHTQGKHANYYYREAGHQKLDIA